MKEGDREGEGQVLPVGSVSLSISPDNRRMCSQRAQGDLRTSTQDLPTWTSIMKHCGSMAPL